MNEDSKICTKCDIPQPLDNFYSKGHGRKMSHCKSCVSLKGRKRYYEDLEKTKVRSRKSYISYRDRHPERLMLQSAKRRSKTSNSQ